jgi:hypothetical protein
VLRESSHPIVSNLLPVPELAEARQLLSGAKRLGVYALGTVNSIYGKSLSEEQEILGHIADIVIDTYALESAILRTEKLSSARRGDVSATAVDITNVFAADAADRIVHSIKQVLAVISAGADDNSSVLALIAHWSFNTVAARRRIAESLVKSGRYPL